MVHSLLSSIVGTFFRIFPDKYLTFYSLGSEELSAEGFSLTGISADFEEGVQFVELRICIVRIKAVFLLSFSM